MDWVRTLAYVTGTVDQELLKRNEYLAAENRIIKAQLKARLKLSDAERRRLKGASRPGQAPDQARRHAADHSYGQREPGLGL
jgi:hypothetical protein